MRFFDPALPVAERARCSRVWHILITVLLSFCLILNMAWIFRMSDEDTEASGDRSGELTDAVVDVIYPNFSERPIREQESIFQKVHQCIRKLAHFSEFMLLGFLSALLIAHLASRFSISAAWLQWSIPALFCLLYAASDEIHQIFTDRGASVTDVLIDFVGAAVGILVARSIVWLIFLVLCKRYDRRTKGDDTA